MLSLLHPAALWTLAALALPLAIHLRRPPPRTVRLGSLRFLENAARRPPRSLRWRELLLLGARLGLLAVLALLLAGLRWTIPPPVGPHRWALLDPTAAPAGDSLARWRTLRQNGYEPRRLAPNFPAAPDDPAPTNDPESTTAPDLWSLLREADAELPDGSALAVFTPTRLSSLRGTRPELGHCKVEWVPTPALDGGRVHEWTASTTEKRTVQGRSDARSTEYTILPPDPRAGTPPAVSVLILHDDEHDADAHCVEAAARAAAESLDRRVNIQNRAITADAENAATAEWTFWLSERPVPEGLARRAPRLLRYAGGAPVAADDWIVAPDDEPADGARLWKRASPALPGPPGVVWWRDRQDNPLLSYSHPADGEHWELFTRFDPAWTDLPRTTALPAWLRTLLFPAEARFAAGTLNDRRLADPSQGFPSETLSAAGVEPLDPADQPSKDLHWPLWTLAALLFAVERFLSLRRPAAPPAVAPIRTPPLAAASR